MEVVLDGGHCINFEHRSRRRLVLLKVNTTCNLRCSYCWYVLNPQLQVDVRDEINSKEMECLISRLALQPEDVVYISGGEPILRRDIIDICKHLSATAATVYITTNGILLKQLMSVAAWIDGYVISIDSVESKYHDIHRGYHRQIIQNLKKLREHCFVCVSVVLSQQNLDQLSALADKCIEWDVNSLFCQLLWYPADHPERKRRCLGSSHSKLFKAAMDQLRRRKFLLRIPAEPYLQLLEAIVANDGARGMVRNCFAQSGYFSVDPHGNINLCLPHALIEGAGTVEVSTSILGKVCGGDICRYFSEECSCLMGHYFTDLFDAKND